MRKKVKRKTPIAAPICLLSSVYEPPKGKAAAFRMSTTSEASHALLHPYLRSHSHSHLSWVHSLTVNTRGKWWGGNKEKAAIKPLHFCTYILCNYCFTIFFNTHLVLIVASTHPVLLPFSSLCLYFPMYSQQKKKQTHTEGAVLMETKEQCLQMESSLARDKTRNCHLYALRIVQGRKSYFNLT